MRRLLTPLVLALVAAGALAPSAATKELSAELAAGPPTLAPGEPWNAQLRIHGDQALMEELAGGNIKLSPSVVIRNEDTGERIAFPAKRTGKRLLYQARVKFPSPGYWSIEGTDGASDRAYQFGSIRIHGDSPAAPPATPTGASREGGSVPVWPLVGGGAALLLAAAAAVVVRRARPGPARVPEAG